MVQIHYVSLSVPDQGLLKSKPWTVQKGVQEDRDTNNISAGSRPTCRLVGCPFRNDGLFLDSLSCRSSLESTISAEICYVEELGAKARQ
jgi:hypothetical protein